VDEIKHFSFRNKESVSMAGGKPMSLQLPKRARRRTQGTTGPSASPPSLER